MSFPLRAVRGPCRCGDPFLDHKTIARQQRKSQRRRVKGAYALSTYVIFSDLTPSDVLTFAGMSAIYGARATRALWWRRGGGVVDYFEFPGSSRKFFRCDALSASLSVEACAQNFGPDSPRAPCRTCPIGAKHAGKSVIRAHWLRNSDACARCQRPTTNRPWLILGIFCPSCYNREREWVRGRNAKGNKPSGIVPLQPRGLVSFSVDGGEGEIFARDRTLSMHELMFSAVRKSSTHMAFAPLLPAPPDPPARAPSPPTKAAPRTAVVVLPSNPEDPTLHYYPNTMIAAAFGRRARA